jgi:oligopeptide/dipeptide ABC transporter ATP-binding protein
MLAIAASRMMEHQAAHHNTLLRLEHLVKRFPVPGTRWARHAHGPAAVHALNDVSIDVRRGETLGIVGESGCGKTTLARAILRLVDLTAGRMTFDGVDITHLTGVELRAMRRRMQMVFQDPYGSLNPRRNVGAILTDAFAIHGVGTAADRPARVAELMGLVGLDPSHRARMPSEFSGGQRQRIGIARAIALHPSLVVCDEPVSALDVSIRAQILNLLDTLQRQLGLTYVFISHDLSVVEHISHRVAVMYLGRIVELAPAAALCETPRHPYTAALLAAVPVADPDVIVATPPPLAGEPPSPVNPPSGCHFHPRCPRAQAICRTETPPLTAVAGSADEHRTACHFPLETPAGSLYALHRREAVAL